MEEIKVKDNLYSDPNTAYLNEHGAWILAKPELWEGFHWYKIPHLFGKHYSYGQPFCIFCGKEKVTPQSN